MQWILAGDWRLHKILSDGTSTQYDTETYLESSIVSKIGMDDVAANGKSLTEFGEMLCVRCFDNQKTHYLSSGKK